MESPFSLRGLLLSSVRFQFSLRGLLLFLVALSFLLGLLRPVARINKVTCSRIEPGMTEREAEQIIGAPPGWYDGVLGYSSSEPDPTKGESRPNWVGGGGKIVLIMEATDHVISKAAYYEVEMRDFSPVDWFWERFTRVRYLGLSIPQRLFLFAVISTLTIWALAVIIILPGSPNSVARHGGIGLVVGLIAAIALFSHNFGADLGETAIIGCGPIGGAIVGVIVGICRNAMRMPARGHDAEIAPSLPHADSLLVK